MRLKLDAFCAVRARTSLSESSEARIGAAARVNLAASYALPRRTALMALHSRIKRGWPNPRWTCASASAALTTRAAG